MSKNSVNPSISFSKTPNLGNIQENFSENKNGQGDQESGDDSNSDVNQPGPSKKPKKAKKQEKKKKSKRSQPKFSSDEDSSGDSVDSDDEDTGKGFLLKNDRLLNSLDLTALQNLHKEILNTPKVLVACAKEGGEAMKNHYKAIKTLVAQVKLIRKNLNKKKETVLLLKSLKKTVNWFSDVFFEYFGPEESSAGYIATFRSELREPSAIFIFGMAAVRRLRCQLKSFGEQHRLLKNAAAITIFNWENRKRGYNNGKKSDGNWKGGKRQNYGNRNNGYDSYYY